MVIGVTGSDTATGCVGLIFIAETLLADREAGTAEIDDVDGLEVWGGEVTVEMSNGSVTAIFCVELSVKSIEAKSLRIVEGGGGAEGLVSDAGGEPT